VTEPAAGTAGARPRPAPATGTGRPGNRLAAGADLVLLASRLPHRGLALPAGSRAGGPHLAGAVVPHCPPLRLGQRQPAVLQSAGMAAAGHPRCRAAAPVARHRAAKPALAAVCAAGVDSVVLDHAPPSPLKWCQVDFSPDG